MKRILLVCVVVLLLAPFTSSSSFAGYKTRLNDGEDSGWLISRIAQLLDQYVPWPIEKSKIIYVDPRCDCSFSVDFSRVVMVVLNDEVVYMNDVDKIYYFTTYDCYNRSNTFDISYIILRDGRLIPRHEILALVLY